MNASTYKDVTQQQLADFAVREKIKCLGNGGQLFKPDDIAISWKCNRNHRWPSSFIDVQINGCPKCIAAGAKKSDLVILRMNQQENNAILVTLRRLDNYLSKQNFPPTTFHHEAFHHFLVTNLLFIGIHLETWLSIREQLDRPIGKIAWTKKTKSGTADLSTAERVESVSKSVAVALKKIKISKSGQKRLKNSLTAWRKTCQFCVDVRNAIAHGHAQLPYKFGKLNANLFGFLKTISSQGIDDYLSEIRSFTDLSEIVLKIENAEFAGKSKDALARKAAYRAVAKAQIQSLFGIV